MSIAKVISSDDMLEKTAEPGGIKQNLLYMGIGGAIQPVISGVTSGIQKVYNHISKKKTWEEIKKRHPELDTEANQERFEAMFDMSPSVMKHVTFAVPSLRSATEYGTGGVPIDLAGKLVNIDAQKNRKPDLAQGVMSGAVAGLSAAQKERSMAQSAAQHNEQLKQKMDQFLRSQDLSERTLAEKLRQFDKSYAQKAEQFSASQDPSERTLSERIRRSNEP